MGFRRFPVKILVVTELTLEILRKNQSHCKHIISDTHYQKRFCNQGVLDIYYARSSLVKPGFTFIVSASCTLASFEGAIVAIASQATPRRLLHPFNMATALRPLNQNEANATRNSA